MNETSQNNTHGLTFGSVSQTKFEGLNSRYSPQTGTWPGYMRIGPVALSFVAYVIKNNKQE